tara:strand:+ start:998 stop:1357 length:360 start_codon:yes stop_codon:yes gene_type:complete
MTKQIKHNKETFDYIISAENGNLVITKYLDEKEWNEDFNEYFTKTQVLIKASNPRYLAGVIEFMNDHAIVGDTWFSSSMDFSTEHGFTKKNTARDLWDKAMDIYRTAESKGQRINRKYA